MMKFLNPIPLKEKLEEKFEKQILEEKSVSSSTNFSDKNSQIHQQTENIKLGWTIRGHRLAGGIHPPDHAGGRARYCRRVGRRSYRAVERRHVLPATSRRFEFCPPTMRSVRPNFVIAG